MSDLSLERIVKTSSFVLSSTGLMALFLFLFFPTQEPIGRFSLPPKAALQVNTTTKIRIRSRKSWQEGVRDLIYLSTIPCGKEELYAFVKNPEVGGYLWQEVGVDERVDEVSFDTPYFDALKKTYEQLVDVHIHPRSCEQKFRESYAKQVKKGLQQSFAAYKHIEEIKEDIRHTFASTADVTSLISQTLEHQKMHKTASLTSCHASRLGLTCYWLTSKGIAHFRSLPDKKRKDFGSLLEFEHASPFYTPSQPLIDQAMKHVEHKLNLPYNGEKVKDYISIKLWPKEAFDK